MKLLPSKLYNRIVKSVPILCVDAVVKNWDGTYFLLVKRNNAPLKGDFWVPGGRVHRGEKIEQSLRRKLREEIGLKRIIRIPQFIGYWEEHFTSGAHGPIHTVSMVYEVECPRGFTPNLDSENATYLWATSLPKKLKRVYPFSQYFQ